MNQKKPQASQDQDFNLDQPRGARIAARRKQIGHTQLELAELIGVGIATLRRWERGRGAQIDELMRLVRALDIDPGWILGTRKEPQTLNGTPIEGLIVPRGRRRQPRVSTG